MIDIRKADLFAHWLDELAGGDKSTQAKDIKEALRLARNLPE